LKSCILQALFFALNIGLGAWFLVPFSFFAISNEYLSASYMELIIITVLFSLDLHPGSQGTGQYKKGWYFMFPFCLNKFLVILGSLFPLKLLLISYCKKLSLLDTAYFRMKYQSFESIDQLPCYFCNM
jgi:hypothetical protein